MSPSAQKERALAVWLDDFSLRIFPGLDADLSRLQIVVMRSFGRIPTMQTVATLTQYRHAAVVGGPSFDQFVHRIEMAVTSLKIPIIAVVPKGAPAKGFSVGPGVVDALHAGADGVARRIATMATVPVVSSQLGARMSPPTTSPKPGNPAKDFRRTTTEMPVIVPHSTDFNRNPPVAIASSTGGAWVLSEMLRTFPVKHTGPVFVAQHMEAEFQGFFAQWLGESSRWRTVVVTEPMAVESGVVYVPEGGKDLCVDATGLTVRSEPPTSRFVPSADRLFATFSEAYGKRANAIVLSGMGADGAQGLVEVLRRGGRGFCQLPSTALIPSMPEAALRIGPQVLALPPKMISTAVLQEPTDVGVPIVTLR